MQFYSLFSCFGGKKRREQRRQKLQGKKGRLFPFFLLFWGIFFIICKSKYALKAKNFMSISPRVDSLAELFSFPPLIFHLGVKKWADPGVERIDMASLELKRR